MNVYVLLYEYDAAHYPEVSELIGVYDSLEKAKNAAQNDPCRRRRSSFAEELWWQTYIVDEPEFYCAEGKRDRDYQYVIYAEVVQ